MTQKKKKVRDIIIRWTERPTFDQPRVQTLSLSKKNWKGIFVGECLLSRKRFKTLASKVSVEWDGFFKLEYTFEMLNMSS